MTKKTIIALIKTVLPLLLGVYLIWYFFSSMSHEDKAHFYQAFSEANYGWIFISLLFGCIALYSRAQRWKYVLEPIGYTTKFWHRYHAIMIGYLVNYTIPRAGEASRSAMLYRSDGVPFMKSFGTIISERAVDVVMLGTITLVTIFLGFDDYSAIKQQIVAATETSENDGTGVDWKGVMYSIIAIGTIGLTILLIVKKKLRDKIIGIVKDILAGVFSIFKSKQPIAYLFHTLVIWASYLIMFLVPFYAIEETANVPIACIFLGFVAGSLGIVFTNGGIGAYPLLVGMVVAFYLQKDYPNDAEGIGKALGMLIWASQTAMMILLGLVSLVLLPKNYSKDDNKTPLPRE